MKDTESMNAVWAQLETEGGSLELTPEALRTMTPGRSYLASLAVDSYHGRAIEHAIFAEDAPDGYTLFGGDHGPNAAVRQFNWGLLPEGTAIDLGVELKRAQEAHKRPWAPPEGEVELTPYFTTGTSEDTDEAAADNPYARDDYRDGDAADLWAGEVARRQAEGVRVRCFNAEGKRTIGGDEALHYQRLKRDREAEADKVERWVLSAPLRTVQKAWPRFWKKLKESRAACAASGDWSRVWLTKVQVNRIAEAFKKRLPYL